MTKEGSKSDLINDFRESVTKKEIEITTFTLNGGIGYFKTKPYIPILNLKNKNIVLDP